MTSFDWRKAVAGQASGFQDFQDLMRRRVQDILLVSSPYDSFILEQDGQLGEILLTEFLDLNLRQTPLLRRVPTGEEAIEIAREQPRFNLIIATPHIGDMNAAALARRAKEAVPGISTVLLAYDHRELTDFVARTDVSALDGVFLWQGDARILLTIVKCVEDRLNVAHDTRAAGVQVILVVVGSSRVDLQACKLEYSIVSPK